MPPFTAPLLSVILCTHDPRADYLRRTLESLRAQTLDPSRWELLIVDNRSSEPVAAAVDLAWQPRARVVREERLGLVHARLRGFAEADADILVYVDDDNVLASGYLEEALRLADTMPHLGVWSARIDGEFETAPLPWMQPYLPFLALNDFPQDRWANHRLGQTLPIGAGMVVRKAVMVSYQERTRSDPRRLLLDRHGAALLAGGDTDIGLAACAIGLGCGYVSALRITHLIPARRLVPDYLVALVQAVTASHVWLNAQHGDPLPSAYARWKLRVKSMAGRIAGPSRALGFEGAVARGQLQGLGLLDRWRAGP